jgi:hypothetical protein
MTDDNSNAAPTQSAPVEPSQIEALKPHGLLTGRRFLHFGRVSPSTGLRDARFGVVEGPVGASHWLLRFESPAGFQFSNVFTTEQLTQFVFVTSHEEQEAFLADLALPTVSRAAAPSN